MGLRELVLASTLVLDVALPSGVVAGEFSLPERLINYHESLPVNTNLLKSGGEWFCIYHYDLDGDGGDDVLEVYPLYKMEGMPLYYGFDLDGDGIISEDEIVIDSAKDGLNGNEIRRFPSG